jgi:hypothetical protein
MRYPPSQRLKAGKGQSLEGACAVLWSYIVQERTIILAVVPANQDVATVDILERAR